MRLLKSFGKALAVVLLLMAAAALVLVWRMSSLTIEPARVALAPPLVTIETDTLKIDLPESFLDTWHLIGALEWPDERIKFTEITFPDQSQADRWLSRASGRRLPEEDVSEEVGHPASLAVGFTRPKDDMLCGGGLPVDERSDHMLCSRLILRVNHLGRALTLMRETSFDTPPPLVPPERQAQYEEELKAEFIGRAKEFLAAYTRPDEESASPPRMGQCAAEERSGRGLVVREQAASPSSFPITPVHGYRTRYGLIDKNKLPNCRYILTSANFEDQNGRRFSFGLDEAEDLPPTGDLLFAALTEVFNPQSRGLEILVTERRLPWRYTRDSTVVGRRPGEELIGFSISAPQARPEYVAIWQEMSPAGRPGTYRHGFTLTAGDRAFETDPEFQSGLGLWRAILDTVEFKNPAPQN